MFFSNWMLFCHKYRAIFGGLKGVKRGHRHTFFYLASDWPLWQFSHFLSSTREPEGAKTSKTFQKLHREKGKENGHVVSCNHKSLATQWKDISDSTCLSLGRWAERTEWPSLGAATLCCPCLLRGWGTALKPLRAAPLGPRLVNVLSQAGSTHVRLSLLCYI